MCLCLEWMQWDIGKKKAGKTKGDVHSLCKAEIELAQQESAEYFEHCFSFYCGLLIERHDEDDKYDDAVGVIAVTATKVSRHHSMSPAEHLPSL